MARSQRVEARKAPLQSRSKQTVASILAAAAQVFADRGYANTTTNHIAERAGVSIGSLYQYFPSKDALLVALAERHVEQAFAAVLEEVGEKRQAPARELLRALVDALLRAHQREPRLHRVIFEEAHLLDDSFRRRLEELDDRALRLARGIIEERCAELAIDDPEMASFVVVHVLEGITHTTVIHHPEMMRRPAFREELIRLLESYLLGAPSKRDESARRPGR